MARRTRSDGTQYNAPKNDVSDWNERLEACKEKRKPVESVWKQTRMQYETTLLEGTDADSSKQIRVNLAFPTIKVLLRSACSSDPFIYISGIRPQDEASGEVLQYLENRLWRIQKRRRSIRQIVLDALLLKVGYGMSHIRKDPTTGRPECYLTRVSPYQLWLEPGAPSVDEAYYIFREVVLSREEAEDRWKNVTFMKYDDVDKSHQRRASQNWNLKDRQEKMERVVVYEIHDQLHHQMAYFTPGHDKYLVKPEDSPYPLSTLFTELIFNEIIDEHYGLSDLEPVAIQQEELDRVRTAMLIHSKRGNRKYEVIDTVDDKMLASLESGEDGAIVKVPSVGDSVKPIDHANLPADEYNYAEIIRADYREIIGTNEYMNAGRISGTKTAYETEQIMSGTRMRLGEKPDLTGEFIEQVAAKDISIMKKLYPVPELVKFYGPEGQQAWRWVQQWELQGEHYVAIHVGSTAPVDEVSQFQKGLLLYQTFGQDPAVPHDALLDEVFKMMNLRNRQRLLAQPPQPAQQQTMPGQSIPSGMNPQSQAMPSMPALQASTGPSRLTQGMGRA